jgi:hypothetical protein
MMRKACIAVSQSCISSCCGKDLGIITEGGGLAIHHGTLSENMLSLNYNILKYSVLCLNIVYGGREWSSEKPLSLAADDLFGNYWWYTFNTNVCLIGYVNVATLTFVHKKEAPQAAYRLLENGCSSVPNFGYSEVLIKRVGRTGAGVFSDILNVRESYTLGSHATVFQSEAYAILPCSEYCISEGIVNRAVSICSDSRAALLTLKSYAVSSRVVLQCRDSLQELVLSNRARLVWVPVHWYSWEWGGRGTCKSGIKLCFCGTGALSSVGTFE